MLGGLRPFVALLVCLITLLSGLAWGQAPTEAGEGLTISGFRAQDYHDDGSLAWVIQGEKAVVRGEQILLRGVRMKLHTDDGVVQVFTAECEFNRRQRNARGKKPVNLRSDKMTLDGVGFDLDLEDRRVWLRHRVRVRIFGKDRNLLDK